MRHKFLRVLGSAAALAVVLGTAACADDGGGDDNNNQGQGRDCTVKIAFFGALTGPNAALGINIRNGGKLAFDKYNNDSNRDTCQIQFDERDSQGDERQAPGIADAIIQDPDIIGVLGPAFSGESRAANGKLSDNGVTIITASATNPTLAQQGWKTFHRALGN
nr:ABC transporter substrate-binding protein [Longispora sp. (in: high G+C Gram-positive bacteria)]